MAGISDLASATRRARVRSSALRWHSQWSTAAQSRQEILRAQASSTSVADALGGSRWRQTIGRCELVGPSCGAMESERRPQLTGLSS